MTADQAWMNLICDVYNRGSIVRPRGIACQEILSYTSRIDMEKPITTIRPKLGYKFLAAEAWWIITGRNDVASIKQYSPHIATFSNDGVRFDGSYGPRIIDQLRYIVDTLVTDESSRQAVLEIWRPNPRPSKDIPCTIAVQWMIRERGGVKYLDCFDTMRSSDAWLGWPYDVFNFSMLSSYIALLLRNHGLCVQLGTLHLTAASQHLYLDPAKDGASNIPYTLNDVAKVIGFLPEPREYSPMDLDEFRNPEEFLRCLDTAKNSCSTFKWMSEFMKVPS